MSMNKLRFLISLFLGLGAVIGGLIIGKDLVTSLQAGLIVFVVFFVANWIWKKLNVPGLYTHGHEDVP